MKSKKIWLVLLAMLCILSPAARSYAQEEASGYADGQAIAAVQKSMVRSEMPGLLSGAEALLETDARGNREEQITDFGETEYEDSVIYMLVTDNDLSTEELIAELSSYPEVLTAEPNYEITAEDYKDMTEYQWGFNNTGQQNGVADVDLNISGWSEENDKMDGSVAVIMDSGIDYTNPDLAGRMWRKSSDPAWASLPGGEYGYNSRAVSDSQYNETDIMDDYYHGTFCAGIAAASWDDQGISGASDNAKLMGVKILSGDGRGYVSDAVRGYGYLKQAVAAGVDITVINNSWGVDQTSEALNTAVTELGDLGAVSVFASGNSGRNLDDHNDIVKSMFHNPYAIVVNSIQSDGTLSAFSNYSNCYTDIASPGTGVLSTVPVRNAVYLAEADSDNLLFNNYESEENSWQLMDSSGTKLPVTSEKVFDGSYSQGTQMTSSLEEFYTEPVNLAVSDTAERYFSIHTFYSGKTTVSSNVYVWCQDDSWKKLETFSTLTRQLSGNGYWGVVSGKLPADTNFESFQVRITVRASGGTVQEGESVYFDCMGVGINRVPYDYQNGTSMAAPAVSGEVTQLAKLYPEESAAKLAARVIGGAVRTEALQEVCVSGGYASLEGAKEPAPVVLQAAGNGGYLTIQGCFFGAETGTVLIDGQQLNVLEWSDNKILVVCDPEFRLDKKKIQVTAANGRSGYQYFFYEGEEREEPQVSYLVHVQNKGWLEAVTDSEISGTIGESLQVEAVSLQIINSPLDGSVEYRAYVADKGWLDWTADGGEAGTRGECRRVEAMEIRLTGSIAEQYDIVYRAHVQDKGWLDWQYNGAMAGTTNESRRIEAVQIKLEKKSSMPQLSYSAHVQNIGWQDPVSAGEMAGTVNLSLQMEAFLLNLSGYEGDGGIVYRAHVENQGWQDWVSGGEIGGTIGYCLRMEALEIKLTGELEKKYDVMYRTHVQNIGWQDWMSNGETAGTVGQSKRVEAIEIKLVSKN